MLSLRCKLQRGPKDRTPDPPQRGGWPPSMFQMWKVGDCMNTAKSKAIQKNRGFMTVEVTVIIPILLLIITAVILLYLTIGKREVLRGEMYQSLYTLGVAQEKDGSPADALQAKASRLDRGASGTRASATVIGDQLVMTGSVRFLEQKVPMKMSRFRKDLSVVAGRERDQCSERLRRWQFYGDITENTGD